MELSHQCKLRLLMLSLVLSYVHTQCLTDDIDFESLVTRYVGLDKASLWTGNTGDIFACARACVRRTICESFNFYDLSGHCDLFHTARTATSPTKEDVYILSSNINNWPLATLDPGCSSRPCDVDEVCMPGHLSVNANPTTECSHTCIRMRIVCPMPPVLSGGRKVNDVNVFTCGRAYVGGDNATCLPNRQWNKKIDTTCTPLLNHPCQDSNFCRPIKADCVGGTCVCRQFMTYSTAMDSCEKDCGAAPTYTGATMTGDGNQMMYTCDADRFLTSDSVATITCTVETGWTPQNSVKCHTCGAPPPVARATSSGGLRKQTYTCDQNYRMVYGSNPVITCTLTDWTQPSLACYSCPDPPQLAWANLTLDGTLGTYTCKFTGTSPTPSSNNTIECTQQGTWQPVEAFFCFGVRFSRTLASNISQTRSPLADGNNSGLVELFYNQSGWVTLKDKGKWTYQLTKLFCKTLNPNFVYGGTYYKDGNPYTSDLDQAAEIEFACTGTELSMADCVKDRKKQDTNHDSDYAIVCYESDVNTDTQLRLMGGKDNNPMWGRLEVLYGGSWYQVCTRDNWDDEDAEAACRTINPSWKRESKSCGDSDCPISSHSSYPFIMNGLQCEDYHVHFMFCPMSADFSSCDSSTVATLKCKL